MLLFDSSNSINRLESAGEIVYVQKKFNYRKDNSTLNKIKLEEIEICLQQEGWNGKMVIKPFLLRMNSN